MTESDPDLDVMSSDESLMARGDDALYQVAAAASSLRIIASLAQHVTDPRLAEDAERLKSAIIVLGAWMDLVQMRILPSKPSDHAGDAARTVRSFVVDGPLNDE